MLNLSTAVKASGFVPRRADISPQTLITRRHAQELARTSDDFGEMRAEVFACRARGMNELEVLADTHTLLLRCDGTATRCEVAWPESGNRQRLAEIRPGSMVFTPAMCSVHVNKKDQGKYRYISVYVPPRALAQLEEARDAHHLLLPPQAGPCQAELGRVVLAMKDEIEDPGPAGTLYKDTLALQLLIQLVRCTSRLTAAPAKGGLSGWRLRRTTEMLEGDLMRTPSIQELATAVELSPAHFCTAFRQSTGYSPHRYLLMRKIDRAKALMLDRRLSLTEIALSSGFGSSSQFATAFRRIDGATPSAYRRSL
jgi:AraC family transcriptional regulator